VALPVLCLAAPVAAFAREEAFSERDRRSDELLERLEESPGDNHALRQLESLADECERVADHRVGKYVAGQLIRYQPDQRRHIYRYVRILRARGEHGEAERELRTLVRARPSVREGWDMLADVVYDQGRYEDSLEVWADCLREHPDDARALHFRAWINLWDLGDLEAAEQVVERMQVAAADDSKGEALQAWFRARAAELTDDIATQRSARTLVLQHEQRVGRWLTATWAAVLLAASVLFFVTRPRS
jgi:tetratricopeptide (TPR) repeat protein